MLGFKTSSIRELGTAQYPVFEIRELRLDLFSYGYVFFVFRHLQGLVGHKLTAVDGQGRACDKAIALIGQEASRPGDIAGVA